MLLGLAPVLAAPYACGASDSGASGGAGFGGSTIGRGGNDGPHVASTGVGGGNALLACEIDRPHDEITKAPSGGSCVAKITPGTGGGGGGDVGGANAGGSSSQGGGSSQGGDSSAGGAGGASSCRNAFQPSTCAGCIEHSCCADVDACRAVEGCIDCFVADPNATGCDSDPIKTPLGTLQTCEMSSCGSQCALNVVYHCNPVTNKGCRGDEACDLSASGAFECFPPPNKVDLCGSCSVTTTPPYCQGGLHCVTEDVTATMGQCGAYCCPGPDYDDCGPNAKCDPMQLLGGLTDVGICVPK
jgi:hypothetical protein